MLGVLPGLDAAAANPWVEIVIPTGLNYGRNVVLTALADVVVAVGGGAGTLSEIALAWQHGKSVVCLDVGVGWSARLSGSAVDERRDDVLHRATSAEEAVELAVSLRISLPGGRGFELRLDELEGKRAWVMGAPKQAFLEAEPEKQAVMLEALAHAVGVDLPPGLAGSLLLRPEEWTELRALGHRLGAHGMTHARLSGLSAEDLEAEVVASIRHVRAIEPRVAFAYPDGAHDEPSRAAVCAAGARSAVTCEHGVVTTRACRFRLPRLFARPPRGPRPSAS